MQRIDTQWFVDTLASRRMSQRGLARHLGCDPSSVHRLLTGKRPMRLDEAEQLAALLGKTVSEVLDHAGIPIDPAHTAPVCGYLDGVLEAHLELDREDVERVAALAGAPRNTFAMRAMTAGSIMQSIDGWLFYVALPPEHDGVQSEAIGRLCLVRVRNGPRLVRWLRRGYRPGTWNLDTMLGSMETRDADVAWASPILAVRQV